MSFRIKDISDLGRNGKVTLQIAADLLLIFVCFVAAMAIRLESIIFVGNGAVWPPLGVSAIAAIAAFWRFGVYRSLVRFVTNQILASIAKGVLIAAATLFFVSSLTSAGIPRSVPFIYAALLFLSVGSVRFFARQYFRKPDQAAKTRVIIYGAGDAGIELSSSLFQGRDYAPVAFVDDDKKIQGLTIGGCLVSHPDRLATLTKALDVKTVLLAMPQLNRERRRDIISELAELGVQVKTVPSMSDIISGNAQLSELREVSPEDLLGRDPVAPNPSLMKKNISGKNVLVTGAGGSIGGELCRQIVEHGPETLILFDVSELGLYSIDKELVEITKKIGLPTNIFTVLGSVQNARRLETTLRSFQVQTVYHAAAYKHVPLIEDNIIEGVRNNVFGTLTLAEAAINLGVESFILISTDKAVRPSNVMGATKRVAELICQAFADDTTTTNFSMVRFGNVLGSSGSVIPHFKSQIAQGGPITVTHPDINRFFMTIPEAAQLVIQAGAMAKGGDVFVLDMGKPVKIADLAVSMAKLHGLLPYFAQESLHETSNEGTIAICFTGLRKGEKLYEELIVGEDAQPTEHPRIMTASEAKLSKKQLLLELDHLHAACVAFDLARVVEILKELPLGYNPENVQTHSHAPKTISKEP